MGSAFSSRNEEISGSVRKTVCLSSKGVPMMLRLVRSLFLVFFVMLVFMNVARAQKAAEPSDDQIKDRLRFIANALRSAQPRAQAWLDGWIAGYGGSAVAMLSLANSHWDDVKLGEDSQPVPDRDFAEDMLVGGLTFALGVGGMVIDPFVPAYGPESLWPMPEGTPEERRLKLIKAEELLRECAQREKKGRGWSTHLLNLGVNFAAGLVTVLAFDRPWYDGLTTFASGEAVSLLNIFTQPRRAMRDLKNYEVGYLGKRGTYIEPKREARIYFGLTPGGFSVGLQF